MNPGTWVEDARAPHTADHGLLRRLVPATTDDARLALVASNGVSIDYGALRREVASTADRLARRLPGDGSVGVALSDPIALVVWTFAAIALHRPVFPVQYDLTAREIDAVAEHEHAAAILVDDPDGGADLRVFPDGPPGRDTRPAPGVHFYTSGTSGRPKGVVRTHESLVTEARAIVERLEYTADSVLLTAVPLYHAYGFSFGVLAGLAAGATVVASSPRTPSAFAERLSRHGVNVVLGVPGLYDVWSRRRPNRDPLPRPRLCVSSGALLPLEVAQRFRQTWGVPVAVQYGSTECGAISVDREATGLSACVGPPYPGVRIEAGTRERPAPVVVHSDYAAVGYVRQTDIGEDGKFTASGIRTGDVGWVDDAGRLHLTGRRSDLVNVHGRKVDVEEVRTVVVAHPGVVDAVVLGVDAGPGQWVAAFVVAPGVAGAAGEAAWEDALFHHCRERLAAHKVPRRFFFFNRIPRTPTGKPRRADLLAAARAAVEDGTDADRTTGLPVTRTSGRLPDGRRIHYFSTAGRACLPTLRPTAEVASPTESQLRWDVWEEDWVVIAAHRQRRDAPTSGTARCPLCPSASPGVGEIPSAAYEVAVFDNRHPALPGRAVAGDGPLTGAGHPLTGGCCEVLSYTADHDGALSRLPLTRIETVIAAWADRTAALNARPDVAQVLCFENRGAQVGATLAHPHGQIYGYPVVPPRLQRLLSVAGRRWERHQECVVCVTLQRGSGTRDRIVADGAHWTAFVPYAARWPYEVRLVPHRHVPDLTVLSGAERTDLARVLRHVLRQFDELFQQPAPYVLSWIQAPARQDRHVAHAHAQIVSPLRSRDRLKYLAAGELAAGTFVNEVPPERAAADLRSAWPWCYADPEDADSETHVSAGAHAAGDRGECEEQRQRTQ